MSRAARSRWASRWRPATTILPTLFEAPQLAWAGPHPEALKHEHKVWPDFHHAPDLEASGRAVDFRRMRPMPSACGAVSTRSDQLVQAITAAPVALDYVVLHPIPNPATPDDPERGYMARVAREVLPRVRARLGAGAT
jgi:hypothetical protein